ncbi:AAA family ATPase [Bacillus sp. FSL K6-1003]|uniref:ATP-dependent nuclease n=1 Tax=Bacillus sp. FSL K6-1003 TaxID=2954675 RepID=UPI0030CEDA1C
MKFTKLSIENFRNFESATINIDNKNVIFGMNDIGKTNFLYALRFLFDPELRRNGFGPSDYNNHNVDKNISITITIDLSDFNQSEDTKKLVAAIHGAHTSPPLEEDLFYIQLKSEFNKKEEYGNIVLFWGSDYENLVEIPSRGNVSALDKAFKVFYVNPLVNLDRLFNKNKKLFFEQSEGQSADQDIIDTIKGLTCNVNDEIGKLTTIKKFQEEITKEYKTLRRENVSVELKSEMAIKGFFSDVIPYIKKDDDNDRYYPTSGDGRRKMLSYSIFNYLAKNKYEDKIIIFLIEEPEISLHRSMQISLSKKLFENDTYNYFFLSTHSPEMLYEMNNTRLIRVHSPEKINCCSYLYNVEEPYTSVKRKLNRSLASALFAERVLLVEGPSELTLFEKVLSMVKPDYELEGGFILQVGGIYFKHYTNALKELNIHYIVKTDNDLKRKKNTKGEYELIGLNRCLSLIDETKLENEFIDIPEGMPDKEEKIFIKEEVQRKKVELYCKHSDIIETLKQNSIYLSRIDLENDLYKVIEDKMKQVFGENPVKQLQDSKLFNMVDLVIELDKQECEDIYNDENFYCLVELTNSTKQEGEDNVI